MGLFTIFGTSLRALTAYSGAMGVVANNIANAANEDYSRQRTEFTTLTPDKSGGIETGRGIQLAGIEQIFSGVIEKRLNENYQALGYNEAKSEYLKNVENILNEVGGGGMNDSLADFFNAWTAVSADPANPTARQAVINTATTLIEHFHTYGESLYQSRAGVDREIKETVPQVNNILGQIADLNLKIQESDSQALNLRDERRSLLNELSKYIDITSIETADQHVQVYMKSGLPLVNGLVHATLDVAPDPDNSNLYKVDYQMGNFTPSDVTDRINGGRLAGLIEVRDDYLTSYMSTLDDLAYTIADQVNSLHSQGYDLYGNFNNDFFTPLTVVEDAARSITINNGILADPKTIALAADIDEIPAGNDIALEIANLYNDFAIDFQSGTSSSFLGYLSDLMATVGNDTNLATTNVNFTQSVNDQIKLDRNQISGVNVDEEQISLVKYQSAYQAAGRMISVANDIIDSLINALI